MSQFIFPPLTASLDSEASDGASSLPSKVMVIGGWDGSNVQAIKTDAAGDLQIDISSITPGTGATDLGKAIQSAQGTTDTGVAALVVRNDTLADLAGSDHDYAPLQVNASGALYVEVKTSGLPSGAATEAKQDTIETTLTAIETDADTIAGAVSGTEMQVDIVASLPAGTNEIGKLAAGTASIGTVVLGAGTAEIGKLAAGTAAIGKLVANDGVDIGDVDVTSIVPGTGATNLGKAIQSAQGTTDTGVPALVVRNDTLADLSGADGDYAPIQVNATGAVYTVLSAGTAVFGKLAANSGVDIGDVTLNAGTAEIGKLAAGTASIGSVTLNANSGVDIGDVDVTSLPALPAGTNTIGKVDVNAIAPVDFLDAGVFDSSTGTNIPSTGSAELVTNLAAACTEIEIQEDIGEFMSLRAEGSGGGGYSVKAYLPLGGGRVKVSLAAGDGIKLFSETGTTISSGKIAINFLG